MWFRLWCRRCVNARRTFRYCAALSERVCLGLRRRPREITDDAIDALMRYAWPGNVRELRM